MFINAQLDLAESLIKSKTQTEMRISKLQGYQIAMGTQRTRLKEISTTPLDTAHDALKEFSSHASSVSELVRDLAGDPLKYANIADKFVNGTLAKKLPQVIANKVPSAPTANQFIDFLKHNDISYKPFAKVHKFFKNAAKFLGVVQIGFEITTVLMETLADQGNWAPTLLRASVAAGAGMVLAEVVTATALTSVISSTFAAAGLTVEAPPVAVALLAAGIVMVATLVIVELYDSMVSLLFGSTSIPASMRLNMSSQMYTRMSSSMSTPMARAMLSNH